jgi:hypothetical protein
MYDRLKTEIRYAFIRNDLDIKASHPDLSPDGIALGLLLQGHTNCAEQPPAERPPVKEPVLTPPAPAEEPKKPKEPEKPEKKKRSTLKDKLDGFTDTFFKDI